MIYPRLSALIFFLFFATRSYANIPKDFKYLGRPINPLCIGQIINNESLESPKEAPIIDLAECSQPKENYKIEKNNDLMSKKGFISIDYTLKDGLGGGYAYYKYLGKYKDLHILYFLQNSGGSGMFSFILLCKRQGDKIQLESIIASGDRCNGGVEEVTFNGTLLNYYVNLTPYDYLALSNFESDSNPEIKNKVKAYDDLAACAACCLGSAFYEHDFQQSRLISVDFGKPISKEEEQTQGQYQACFNQIVRDYQKKFQHTLTPDQLNEFISVFNKECIKP